MRPGDLIAGRFTIDHLAGFGGMGRVFRAHDERGEPVAVKILHRPGEEARFAREAEVLAALAHPAIVRYLAHGETPEGQPFLVTEWLEGETLAARLERGALSAAEAVELGARVADALGAAHRLGIVHRDLKPSNLFLPGGEIAPARILDFGIARVLDREAPLTATGAVLGTTGYMAPEQARGSFDVDARADIFALGCVLFRCLAGVVPFTGADRRAVLMKLALGEEKAPRLREARGDVPEALDELVAAMLARAPDDRPRDAGVVAAALAAVREGGSSAAPEALRPRLGPVEQRLMSLVLAAGALAAGEDENTHTTPSLWSDHASPPPLRVARRGVLAEVADQHRGRAHALPGGALAITVADLGVPTDRAALAVRAAEALGRVAAGAPIAVVSGWGVPSSRLRPGALVDRAMALLRGPGSAGVRKDALTAELLAGRFDVEGGEPAAGYVGREREIEALLGLFEECASGPAARAVVVSAEAGMGKSRLGREFVDRLRGRGEAPAIFVARGDPLTERAPFGLLGRALRRAAGIDDGAPPAAQRRVFEAFLAAACAARPLVLVLDELESGDAATVASIDAALGALEDRPLFVLALGRPEVHEIFPELWARRGASLIRLPKLTRRASERFARQALGPAAGEERVRALAEDADGNAFTLEALLRSTETAPPDAAPARLAMAAARLEAMEPPARRLLRAASVFGQRFCRGGVAALLGRGSEDEWFARLVEREVISRPLPARFAGEVEHRFCHALMREAAYAMLSDRDRALGHLLAAAWLEDAGEDDPEVVADHRERGGDHGAAHG
jgi:hypothetical protein